MFKIINLHIILIWIDKNVNANKI